MSNPHSSLDSEHRLYTKTELVNGSPQDVKCIDLQGQTFEIHGHMLRTAVISDEWFQDVSRPEDVIRGLSGKADLFTFWQRLPNVEPQYSYYMESESLAVLEIESYENWWTTKIKSRIRTAIRKARKSGVVVSEVPFDDSFVEGMTAIFNETPIRQGRAFWHYGKDFETVKAQFSRFEHRETMIGAYVDDEMIGFVMLGNAGPFAILGQILSSVQHRNKVPNNCLVDKAVEIAAERGQRYLVYGYWSDGSLSEFKRRCGFTPLPVPKYFVPLTWVGRFALKTGLYRGWKWLIPDPFISLLKKIRFRWLELRRKVA